MKRLNWLGYLFAVIGLGLLTGSYFWYQSVAAFIDAASVAEGTVIDLARSRSSGSGSGSSGTTYRPVVTFRDAGGRKFEFISTSGSNPPSYRRGERVEVFYDPADPQDARINGFFSLWGGPLIIGIIGGVFTLFGAGFTLPGLFRRRSHADLKQRGMPVQTRLQGVEQNRSTRVKGRSPYRVITQWQDPRTSQVHVFTSEDVWFDPSEFIHGKEILVYIDRDNPRRYFVDLSFLPKLAD